MRYIAILLALLLCMVLLTVQLDSIGKDVKTVASDIHALRREQIDLAQRVDKLSVPILPPPLPVWEPNPDIPLDAELQKYASEMCYLYGVPYEVLLAVIEHESGFNPNAIGYNRNGTHDSGLCQINSVNHAWLLEQGIDVHTPAGNIHAAVVMLGGWIQKYDLETALRCYASGEHGAIELGRGKWFAEEITKHKKATGDAATSTGGRQIKGTVIVPKEWGFVKRDYLLEPLMRKEGMTYLHV